jgi:hypothetical protein
VPSPYLIGLELVMLGLFVLCLRHALGQGAPAVTLLVAGVLFGLLLEWATIQQLQAYSYGRFPVMLGDVPVAIGIGWGTIIYAARLVSNRTAMPEWARPVLDGLLALNVDLSMDAIAIRLGMWDWGRGLAYEYFGVPWPNFWAWFWVVFFFSGGVRLLSARGSHARRTLAPFGAVLTGVAGVLATNRIITRVVPSDLQGATVAATLVGALVLVVALRPRLPEGRLDTPAWAVPLTLHGYFLAAGLLSGALLDPPVLLAVSAAMLVLAALLHRRTLRPAATLAGAGSAAPPPPTA